MPIATQRAVRAAMAPLALRLGAPHDGDLTFLHAVHGGTVVADVVSQTSGNESFARKTLGAPRNEDFRVECAQATSNGLLDWVVASWGSKQPAHEGAVLACDLDYLVRDERGFTGALIAATAFPAFDAAAKTAGRLSVTFTPLTILPATDPGTTLAVNLATGAEQKRGTRAISGRVIRCAEGEFRMRLDPHGARRCQSIPQPSAGNQFGRMPRPVAASNSQGPLRDGPPVDSQDMRPVG